MTWAAAALLAGAQAANAAPDVHTPIPTPIPSPNPTPTAAAGDAVLHLLQERGLLPAQVAGETQQLVSRVRVTASELVLSAMHFLGVPYRRGGHSPEHGFDCSGFTRHIFERSVGLVLPRRADQQANEAGLQDVRKDELKPGDLVFFNTMRRAFSHVGIYVGEGKFIHSPRTGGQVRVEDMREAYWAQRFNGARRADIAAGGAPMNARESARESARDPLRNATRP